MALRQMAQCASLSVRLSGHQEPELGSDLATRVWAGAVSGQQGAVGSVTANREATVFLTQETQCALRLCSHNFCDIW